MLTLRGYAHWRKKSGWFGNSPNRSLSGNCRSSSGWWIFIAVSSLTVPQLYSPWKTSSNTTTNPLTAWSGQTQLPQHSPPSRKRWLTPHSSATYPWCTYLPCHWCIQCRSGCSLTVVCWRAVAAAHLLLKNVETGQNSLQYVWPRTPRTLPRYQTFLPCARLSECSCRCSLSTRGQRSAHWWCHCCWF